MTDQTRPIPPAGISAECPEMAQPQPQAQVPRTPPSRRIEGFLAQLAAGAKRFPATIALTVAASAGIAMLWNSLFNGEEYAEVILTLVVSGSVGALASVPIRLAFERSEKQDRPFLAGLIPLALALVVACLRSIAFAAGRETLFLLGCAGAGICAVAATLFVLTDSSNAKELFAHLACASVLAGFVSSLLQSGIMICLLAFSTLISELDPDIFFSTASCVSSIVYVLVMCSQLPQGDRRLSVPRPYRIIAGYVVLPLCLLLLAVLYGYIIRIILAWEMPSGTMNWFGSFALLVEIGLWLGLQPLDSKPARLFVRWGWALVLPVTAVQILGVVIRVSAYGLTALRAGGIACLLVGICAIVIQALQKSPKILYAICAIAALVFTISPANVLDIAYLSQSARLSSALEELKADPSEEVRLRLTGSWDYLQFADSGYFPSAEVERYRERSNNEGFEELFGVEPAYEEHEQEVPYESTTYYVSFVDYSHVDVEGFSSFYEFDASTDKSGATTILDIAGGDMEIDASEIIDRLAARTDVEDDEKVDLSGTGELMLDLEDGKRIVLTSVDIFYEDGEIETVYLYGYVLLP